jgi:hypothetical protein
MNPARQYLLEITHPSRSLLIRLRDNNNYHGRNGTRMTQKPEGCFRNHHSTSLIKKQGSRPPSWIAGNIVILMIRHLQCHSSMLVVNTFFARRTARKERRHAALLCGFPCKHPDLVVAKAILSIKTTGFISVERNGLRTISVRCCYGLDSTYV